MKRTTLTTIAVSAALLGGCATLYKIDDARLAQQAAFTLGVDASDVTISDSQFSGMRTTFKATVRNGASHNCYVTGQNHPIAAFRVVSDAVCSQPGRAPSNPMRPG